jgi:hypothetical protein
LPEVAPVAGSSTDCIGYGFGGLFFKVGPFSKAGTLKVASSNGCEALCDFESPDPYPFCYGNRYDSILFAQKREANDTARFCSYADDNYGNDFSRLDACSTLYITVTEEDVAQQRDILIQATNFFSRYYNIHGGFDLTVSFECANTPRCPWVVLSNKFAPPNGKLQAFNVTAFAADPALPAPQVRITGVSQTEPLLTPRNNKLVAQALYNTAWSTTSASVSLVADLNPGNKDGRTYFVSYEAKAVGPAPERATLQCSGTVAVCVPRTPGGARPVGCVDNNQRFDSRAVCMP